MKTKFEDKEFKASLKTNLICRGVETDKKNLGGAGPTGEYIILPDNSVITAPSYFGEDNNPLDLKKNGDKYFVTHKGKNVEIRFRKNPSFYEKKTSKNNSMKKVAVLHGKNCLATTLFQNCKYIHQGKKCSFCGIAKSLENKKTVLEKNIQELAEVAEEAKENGATHVTLTTGVPEEEEKGINLLADASEAIKKKTNLPIHVQYTPTNRHNIEKLYSAGADTIGVHLESWDPEILKKYCPGKSEIGRKKFLESMEQCIDLFGKNQVSSYLIAGLGEKKDLMIEGIKELAKRGVIPFIVPFHPIPGTELEEKPLPDPNYLETIYQKASEILEKNSIEPEKSKAGCVRCGSCSALKEFME